MTSVTRVATAQRYESLLDAMQQNKAAVARAEAEIATGLKADIFADSAGKSGLSLELRGKKDVLDAQIVANTVTAERQDSAAMLLSTVADQVVGLRDILLQPQAWRMTPAVVTEGARAALENVVAALNTSYGGTYLFSGRATDTAPYGADGSGGYVYQGDATGQFTAQIADGGVITVAPRGDAAALGDAVALLGQLANADLSSLSATDIDQLFSDAMRGLTAAYDGIVALEGAHGNAQARLANTLSTQKALTVSYNKTIIDLEGVDPEEAAIRLKEAQTRLDSTYAITAQLANLSLLNHL